MRQFKYLGRDMLYDDNNTPAVRHNIKTARWTWGQFQKVPKKEEVQPCVAGMFYQVGVASILLCGSEIWVVSSSVMRELEGFHEEAARQLAGMRPEKVKGE